MISRLYDNTYLDLNGNKIIWDNSVNTVLYYAAGDESWDRTGNGKASWYLENTLPYDSFYGSQLSSDRWSYFNYKGIISGSVDSKLKLEVYNSESRGGVTSDNLWKILGDFDIKVYLDENSYYNEYRGNVSSGLTISIDNSNKYRISKYCDNVSIGYKSDYVLDSELKFYGWTSNGDIDTTVGEDSVTCLRLVREGDVVSSYVSTDSGFSQVGSSVSGTVWGQSANVEIEIETEQYNTYKAHFLGFTVSGTLEESNTFSSQYRGSKGEFPENAIISVDGSGMSIIDDADKSLWMRFVLGSRNMFRNVDTKMSASEGKIFYTTSSGIFCLDFVEDKIINYRRGQTLKSNSNIATRNYPTSLYNSGTNAFVVDDDVLDIDIKKIDGNEYTAVATVSGIGLRIGSEDKVESPLSGRVQRVYISEDGRMYWNSYSQSTGSGKLYYREGIAGLIGAGSSFSFSSYYDTTTEISIASENINDIYVDTSFGHRLVLAHSCGVDYIEGGSSIKYGPTSVVDSIQDPTFSSYLGLDWLVFDSSSSSNLKIGVGSVGVFPALQVSLSSEWFSAGSKSLKFSCGPNVNVILGDYRGVYQQVDFTGIDSIYFDFKLVSDLGTRSDNFYDLEVMVGSEVLLSFSDTEDTYISLNNVVDVSGYTGVSFLIFRMKSKYAGDSVTDNFFYIDNIRSSQTSYDHAIMNVESHNILEAILLYGVVDKKVFFANADGFGAIDLITNTIDFFSSIGSLVSLSTIISSEYVEVVDEV